ncbi:hypothetical protein TIFTF001_030500 [Ficus carica]|uniref:Uncharacterized protein n=1 Tax=Ficus carica TaxID=3494 RepID=A0AA88IZT7_FICCA|nr:hypothetical protein TIFTF001_030500 [Ficus carica]
MGSKHGAEPSFRKPSWKHGDSTTVFKDRRGISHPWGSTTTVKRSSWYLPPWGPLPPPLSPSLLALHPLFTLLAPISIKTFPRPLSFLAVVATLSGFSGFAPSTTPSPSPTVCRRRQDPPIPTLND